MVCRGLTGVTTVSCKANLEDNNDLEIILEDVYQETGLFKVQVEGIQNAASLKLSSKFEKIY